ncbi:hypothetical protein DQW77_09635 [Roseovarius sp. TE539]|uniref:hypothetical protein n=1 Tax=Roseovarius sp. TE539 TaxID=2249812 RepID=UPI000DDE44CC|nr:hypothetical protein [Roseovarius sp. TE539]RBI73101.1 hypothetical protein DQW77_09635 [Roseovarius sp. TE539]
MTRYNSQFELTVDDVELIEAALRREKADLSSQLIEEAAQDEIDEAAANDPDASLRRISELLGRLHNQKVFYRPRSGAYVGG